MRFSPWPVFTCSKSQWCASRQFSTIHSAIHYFRKRNDEKKFNFEFRFFVVRLARREKDTRSSGGNMMLLFNSKINKRFTFNEQTKMCFARAMLKLFRCQKFIVFDAAATEARIIRIIESYQNRKCRVFFFLVLRFSICLFGSFSGPSFPLVCIAVTEY